MSSTIKTNSKQADAERLADLFITLQRSFVLNLSKELARGKVSFPQYMLLGFLLQEQTPMTMTEVAAKMRHTTAAATGIVDRLEKLGLIKRGDAPKDRRKIMVNITAKGEALVQNVKNDMVNNILGLMEHLDPIEQTAWLSIYEKISPHCPR
jgi:DNA-binding MarR family transcriptional regulator